MFPRRCGDDVHQNGYPEPDEGASPTGTCFPGALLERDDHLVSVFLSEFPWINVLQLSEYSVWNIIWHWAYSQVEKAFRAGNVERPREPFRLQCSGLSAWLGQTVVPSSCVIPVRSSRSGALFDQPRFQQLLY